jgi:predicted Zn-dependent protease
MPSRPSPPRARLALALLLAASGCPRPAERPGPVRPPPAPAPAPVDPCAPAPVPATAPGALARVDALLRCGDLRGALDAYAALLRRDPRPRWAHDLTALALAEGAPGAARAALEALDRDSPARAVGLALLDVADYERRGDIRDRSSARMHFQAALARTPGDPYALTAALRLYLAIADREPERQVLAAALCREHVPAGPPAAAELPDPHGVAVLAAICGEVSLRAGEPTEARRRFELAARLDPEAPGPRIAWAHAELAAGNDARAAELYAAAAAAPASRDRYTANFGLGVARGRLHDRHGAEAAYRAALAARGLVGRPPTELPPELQFNLGSLLAASDDPGTRAEARALLQAYQAHPEADQPRRLRCQQLLLELQSSAR